MEKGTKRLMFIVNPISGTHSKEQKVKSALAELRQGGWEIDYRPTEFAGHASELAREAVDKAYYGVVACGGDGTINETASSLCGTEVALGIIAAGSGNGLARHLELPLDGRHAAIIINENNVRTCDYGTVNGRPFFCTCGVGFDAAVSMRFASQKKRGPAMYIKSVFDEFSSYRPDSYELSVDGSETIEFQAMMVAFCNASQYGNNAFIAPHASIADGMLDVVVVHPRHLWSKAAFGMEMMTGFVGSDEKTDVFRGKHMELRRSKEGPAHIDGEPLILPDKLEVECHPGKIRIFINASRGKFLPVITPLKMAATGIANNISNLFTPSQNNDADE